MTPYAMRVARALTADQQLSSLAMQVIGATCFDFTPVVPLVMDAADELQRSAQVRDDDPHMDHGGLLFLPDDLVWLEWRSEAGRSGILCTRTEDQIGYVSFNPNGQALLGMLHLFEDGTFVPRLDARQDKTYKDGDNAAALCGMIAAATLMLINAPRGVIRVTSPPHKGFRREMKHAHGNADLKPYHVIKLDKRAGNIGADGAGGAPKGFHFCRAHLRQLPERVTMVRAHWRGDPALGICRATYKVAA